METKDPIERDAKAKSLQDKIYPNENTDVPAGLAEAKQIHRRMALRSASDRKIQQATRHRLIPIAPALPANPRQIKRIINGIALFQEIARTEQQIQPGTADWCKLALWVVIMTEWSQTWTTLTRYPGLLDRIRPSVGTAPGTLPDEARTEAWVATIKGNKAIMRLLDFGSWLRTAGESREISQTPYFGPSEGDWSKATIDSSTIEQFRAFMPSVGGNLLPEPSQETET